MRTLGTTLLASLGFLLTPDSARAQSVPELPAQITSVAQKPDTEKPRAGQLVNVRIDATIADQHGTDVPTTRSVGLVVADRGHGTVRSTTVVTATTGSGLRGAEYLPLSIDAYPVITDGKIRLRISFDYGSADRAIGDSRLPKQELKKSLELVLESGKAVVAADSVDSTGDRKVTFGVKATILR